MTKSEKRGILYTMEKLSERKRKRVERKLNKERTYKLFLYNRLLIYALAVLAQLIGYGLLLVLFVYNSAYATALQVVVGALALVFVLVIVNDHEKPSMKLSWIIVILVAPVFGVPMYILLGRGRPTRKMAKKFSRAIDQNKQALLDFYGERKPVSEKGSVSSYLERVANYPPYFGGDITYYKSGEDIFPTIKEALLQAEKFILLEYFIIAPGRMWKEILQILVEKAMQGVKIRIIYDDFGCMVSLPPKYENYLENLHENIKCMKFNFVVPFFVARMNNRDHRKMIVIDGKVAFTGGFNLADEYINEKRRFGYWKDSGLKITGNSVNAFTQMFFNTFNAFHKDKEDIKDFLLPMQKGEGALIQPYDDSPLDAIRTGESVYTDLINKAEKYVYIFTPYLVLDDFMRSALCSASLRGVDVRIVTPGIPDKKTTYRLTRANYGVLIKAGVKIYEYTPGFIHSKSMLCDGKRAVVGTINLDYRSLYHHFENAVYFEDENALNALKADCEETFTLSTERTKENTKRGVIGRFIDAILRVFETLM